MRFTELNLVGAFTIDIEPHRDSRGFFARTFCVDELAAHGLATDITQCSTSFNERRGTLRGLHYQSAPHEETKIVRCTAGAIVDVIVDLRPHSPTYTRWESVELTSENHRMLYIPAGFAHGFQTLVDATEVFYQISTEYVASASRGIRWNDPRVAIGWPLPDIAIISPRDLELPLL